MGGQIGDNLMNAALFFSQKSTFIIATTITVTTIEINQCKSEQAPIEPGHAVTSFCITSIPPIQGLHSIATANLIVVYGLFLLLSSSLFCYFLPLGYHSCALLQFPVVVQQAFRHILIVLNGSIIQDRGERRMCCPPCNANNGSCCPSY